MPIISRIFPTQWIRGLTCALLWLFAGLAQGAEAEIALPLSLTDAMRIAKSRHVEVLVADERVLQSLARISQAKASFYPKLDGSISMTRQTVNLKSYGINLQNLPQFNPSVPPFNVFDARVSLQQVLFDLSVLRRLKAARAGERLSEAERTKAETDAMALVGNLYLEAHRADEGYQYTQALLRRDVARRRDAVHQQQLGTGASIQVTEARAAEADSRHRVAQAKAEREERRLDLVAALGLPQTQMIHFTFQQNLLREPLPSEEDIRSKVSFHPDLEVARKQVELDTKNRGVEAAAYYPRVNVTANYGPNGPHPGDVDDTYLYGGSIAVPIYQGGLRKAKVKEAASKIRESKVQLDQIERDRLAAAFKALEILKQAFVGVQAAQENLTKAGQQLELARQRNSLGVGDALEVIDYEAQYANAKDVQSEAVATYRLAWVNLSHSLGTMDRWLGESH